MKKILLLGVAYVLACGNAGAQDDKTPVKGDPKKIIATLIKDLEKKDNGDARVQAAMGLADFGPLAESAVPALIDALQTKDEDLRLNAAIALGKIGKAGVAPLGEMLSSPDVDTRFYAIWAIGWIELKNKPARKKKRSRLPTSM